MFVNSITNVYNNQKELPINKIMHDWAKKNYPDKVEAVWKVNFKNEYWDKLPKEEQDRLLAEQHKAIEEEKKVMKDELTANFSKSHHTLSEYQDIANKAYNYVKKTNPDVSKPPKVSIITGAEKAKRAFLQQKALKIAASAQAETVMSLHETNSINFLNSDSKQIDRAIQNMCHIYDSDGNDLYEKNMDLLRKPLIEIPENKENKELYDKALADRLAQENERRALLDNILNENIALAMQLRNPMSDEEYLNVLGDDRSYRRLQSIAEIQKSNYDSIVEGFGVKPSPEVEEKWLKMSDEFIADSAMMNRLGYIANPLYSEVSNPEEALELFNYLTADGPEPDIYDAANQHFGLDEDFDANLDSHDKLLDLREKGKDSQYKFIAREHMSKAISFSMTKENAFAITASIKIPATITDRYNIEKDNIKYTDLDGNEIDLYGAYERMYSGKSCKVYDKENNKYCGELIGGTLDKSYGSIKEPDIPANYNINNADPEELMQNMKGLNNEISNATHWYMPSSKEFTDLRKAMYELQKPNAFDDLNQAKEKMQEVCNLANAYIKLKEKEGTEITDNTSKRLAIAHKIASSFERTLDEATRVNELDNNELENNHEDVRERITVEEAGNEHSQHEIENELEEPAVQMVEEKSLE